MLSQTSEKFTAHDNHLRISGDFEILDPRTRFGPNKNHNFSREDKRPEKRAPKGAHGTHTYSHSRRVPSPRYIYLTKEYKIIHFT